MRDKYEEKMQAGLEELKIEIGKLREKASQVETNMELEYYTRIEELETKLHVANQKLQLLKQTHDSNWQKIKLEFELIWDSLNDLIKLTTSP
jgi:hypothetical protein